MYDFSCTSIQIEGKWFYPQQAWIFIWHKTICFDIVHPFEEFTHNMDQMIPIVEQKDVPLKFLVSFVSKLGSTKVLLRSAWTAYSTEGVDCLQSRLNNRLGSTQILGNMPTFSHQYWVTQHFYSFSAFLKLFQNSLWFAFYNLMMCHCTVEVKASKIMDCTGTDSDNQCWNLVQ